MRNLVRLLCILVIGLVLMACAAAPITSEPASQSNTEAAAPVTAESIPATAEVEAPATVEAEIPATTEAEVSAVAAETRLIKHAMGETEVPLNPQRVVVLDSAELDAVITLGVKPVGSFTLFEGEDFLSYLKDELAGVQPAGTIDQPNLEAITALKPDLILSNKVRHEDIYDELSTIAPTVFAEAIGAVWQDNFKLYAEALGKQKEAEAVIANYHQRLDAFKEHMGDRLNTQVSVLRVVEDGVRILQKKMYIGVILADAGLARPPAQDVDDRFQLVSFEQIPEMDGDVIFISTYGKNDSAYQRLLAQPLWQANKAVTAGQVYPVNDDIWQTGLGYTSANLVIDDLERYLLGNGELAAIAEPDVSQPAADERATLEVTDLAGRAVVVPQPLERIILGEARQMYVMAMLERGNPLARVVGWNDDFQPNDLNTYNLYLEKFPAMADMPNLGSVSNSEFSVEQAIVLKPDLLILSLGSLKAAQETGLIEQLAAVDIPVLFIDYREHPLENTIPSTLLLGQILGRQAEATEVVTFYQEHIDAVISRTAEIAADEKPTVFIERAAGLTDCCATWGSESLGRVIELVGGRNIGTDILGTPTGTLNPEQVIVANPAIYLLTGANWTLNDPENSAVSLGAGADPQLLQTQLRNLASRPGYETLQAVKNGRFHVVWHQFYNSPYNFVTLELFAKWLHPNKFTDLDPEASFREFHERFLPIEYRSGYWASLEPAQ